VRFASYTRVAIVLGLLLLISIVAVVWALNAPGQRFLPAFARLLTRSAVQAGAFSVLSGRSTAAGTFGGRDVSVELKLRRGRHDQGHLVVSMRMKTPAVMDAAAIDAHTTGDTGRRALFTLAKHDLMLRAGEGWLHARWQPQGFVLFPGAFAESKWREILDSIHAVAASLDMAPSAPS
jgi:hypothetical protein